LPKAHSDRRHGCRNLPAQTRPGAPWPIDLRFAHLRHPEAGTLPCLVAGLRDVAGQVVAMQRIFLASDGRGKAPVAQPKMSLGPIKGHRSICANRERSDCLVM
jgi:DNA primase